MEVLEKINRYRVIKKMGRISVPPYPGRGITREEVVSLLERLIDEIDLFFSNGQNKIKIPKTVFTGKNYNDIYKELWKASKGLDAVLGVRGFNPSDSFVRSEDVLEVIKFLRKSQGQSFDVKVKARHIGKHPNHSLEEVYLLLKKINKAEKKIGMKNPVEVYKVPRRVITPTEVYDAIGTVLAELQHIKYSLGLEKDFIPHTVKVKKTPQDVIDNLQLANALMPDFADIKNIKRIPPLVEEEKPNVFFAIIGGVLENLKDYALKKKIKVTMPEVKPLKNLKPKHIYQEGLEVLEKINNLRVSENLFPMSVPRYPMWEITPNEVHDLVGRIKGDVKIIMGDDFKEGYFNVEYQGKRPEDIYRNLWRISVALDTIVGREYFTMDEVFHESQTLFAETQIIGKYYGLDNIDEELSEAELKSAQSFDMFKKSVDILNIIHKIQRNAGMKNIEDISVLEPDAAEEVEENIFDHIRFGRAELVALKLYLGLDKKIPDFDRREDSKEIDIHILLKRAEKILLNVLNKRSK